MGLLLPSVTRVGLTAEVGDSPSEPRARTRCHVLAWSARGRRMGDLKGWRESCQRSRISSRWSGIPPQRKVEKTGVQERQEPPAFWHLGNVGGRQRQLVLDPLSPVLDGRLVEKSRDFWSFGSRQCPRGIPHSFVISSNLVMTNTRAAGFVPTLFYEFHISPFGSTRHSPLAPRLPPGPA